MRLGRDHKVQLHHEVQLVHKVQLDHEVQMDHEVQWDHEDQLRGESSCRRWHNEDQLRGKSSCRSWQEGDPQQLTHGEPQKSLGATKSRLYNWLAGAPQIPAPKCELATNPSTKFDVSWPPIPAPKSQPQYRAPESRKSQNGTHLQPVANVGADNFRFHHAIVAKIFKPFSFVKDFHR